MRKFAICFLCLAIIFSLMAFPASAEEDKNSLYSGVDATSAIIEKQVVTNATSAIVYELNSDTMLVSQNIDERMYPASLVKVMTAYIAIEMGNLNTLVTVTQEAINASAGSTSVNLQVGEGLSLRELLYCMLTGSANDAAAAIAIHIGGSIDGFVALMNTKAEALGCKDTHFVDPHGITSRNQYTTARDMVRIFKTAVEQKAFCDIFGAVRHTVPATNYSPERELKTANYLMDKSSESYYDGRVTGGRTGTAADRSRCLGVTAESGNMKAIAIVFGAKSQFAADGYTVERYGSFREISQLLNATISAYKISQVFYEDQVIAQRQVLNGDNDLVLVPASNQTVILPQNINITDITYRFSDTGKSYVAPIEQGSVQGVVEVWFNGKCMAAVDLIARNDVSVASSKLVNLSDYNNLGFGWIVIAVLGAVVVVLILRQRRIYARRKRVARRQAVRRSRLDG